MAITGWPNSSPQILNKKEKIINKVVSDIVANNLNMS